MHQKNRWRLLPERLATTLNVVCLSFTVGAAFVSAIAGIFTIDALSGPARVPAVLWFLDGIALAVLVTAAVAYEWVGYRTPFTLAEQERLAEMTEKDPEVRALLRRAVDTYGKLDRRHLEAADKLFSENMQSVQDLEKATRTDNVKARLARALGSDL